MGRQRRKENAGLPARWTYKHGAYFYRVPIGHERFWGGKQFYRLGGSFEEAMKTYAAVGSKTYPEDSSLPPIPSLDALSANRVTIPKRGVYFLFRDGELVYIGRSDGLISRLASHTVLFDSFHCIAAEGFIQERLEQLCIAHFRPPENAYCGGGSPRSETSDFYETEGA